MTGVAIAVFAAWFVATAVSQIRTASIQALRRYDVLGLLPGWNFFAPQPITSDLFVRCRWIDEDGVSPWRELDTPARRRPADAVLNLHRRERKALFDNAAMLARGFEEATDKRDVVLSSPYLLLLGVATAAVPGHAAVVQFRIDLAVGGDEREVFRSALHAVPDR